MNEIGIGLLSFAVICLVVISYLDYRWCKRLEERITELEYKNKHRVFTGGKPTNKLSGAKMNNARREKNMQHEYLLK